MTTKRALWMASLTLSGRCRGWVWTVYAGGRGNGCHAAAGKSSAMAFKFGVASKPNRNQLPAATVLGAD